MSKDARHFTKWKFLSQITFLYSVYIRLRFLVTTWFNAMYDIQETVTESNHVHNRRLAIVCLLTRKGERLPWTSQRVQTRLAGWNKDYKGRERERYLLTTVRDCDFSLCWLTRSQWQNVNYLTDEHTGISTPKAKSMFNVSMLLLGRFGSVVFSPRYERRWEE